MHNHKHFGCTFRMTRICANARDLDFHNGQVTSIDGNYSTRTSNSISEVVESTPQAGFSH
jgi:hypothetical protein